MTLTERQWRVGRKLGRTIYAMENEATPTDVDTLIGLVETRALAAHIVAVHNAATQPCAGCTPPCEHEDPYQCGCLEIPVRATMHPNCAESMRRHAEIAEKENS